MITLIMSASKGSVCVHGPRPCDAASHVIDARARTKSFCDPWSYKRPGPTSVAVTEASTRQKLAVNKSSARITLGEGDVTQDDDHLHIELLDTQEMALVLIQWPVKATLVRPAAYGDAAAKALRLLANADVELARLRHARR
jgi:hypothetical protein